jgi:iron complex outermembrane recepter protein
MKTRHPEWSSATLLALGSFMGFAFGSTASAQQSETPAFSGNSPGNTALQEVVVTAQYRSESAQHVPMSISVLTSQTLEVRDVKNLTDFINTIPNVSYAIGQSAYGFAGSYAIAIRGISGSDTTGFYLDDTPVPDSIDPHIVGVQRIEVLRGPQGTLYGARSMGGTVRLLTVQPDTENFSATAHAGVSDTEHTDTPNTLADGAVNLPLIHGTLGLRLEGYYEYDAGFFDRTSIPAGGTPATSASSPAPFDVGNVGRMDTRGSSLSLLWQLSDNLTITPRVLYQRDLSNGFPVADLYYNPAGGAPTLKPTSFDQERLFNLPEYSTDIWSLSSLNIKYHTSFGDLTSSTSYFKRDIDEDENQSEFVYLVLIQPFDAAPLPSTIGAQTRFRRYVEEVRFVSQLPGPVQFVAGAYYADTYGNFDPANGPPAIVPGLNAESGGVLGSDDVFEQFNHQQITEPALYGDASWSATRELELTAGLRAYRVNTANSSYQAGLAVGPTPLIGAPTTLSAQGVIPKFQAQYQLTPNDMLYTLASKGFRPGGLQLEIPANQTLGCVANLAEFGLTPADTRYFKSDSLWNYEIGSKNSWDGDRFVLNGDAYYIRWNDIQQTVALPCGYAFTGNAGAAKSEGAELDASLRPLPGLDLSASAGYEHAVITAKGAGIGALSPQLPGSPVYMVPDWTANLEATYSHQLTAAYSMVYHFGYSYVGNRRSGNVNPFEPRLVPAYGLLEANLGLQWSHYELLLTGKNLTDTIASYGDYVAISAELPGRPRVAIAPPRTVGLEFRYNLD